MSFVKELTSVCLLLTALVFVSTAADCTEEKCVLENPLSKESHLFHSLEDALVKKSEYLYSLQETLFSKQMYVQSIRIEACVTMATAGQQNYSKVEDDYELERGPNSFGYFKCWDYQWTSSAMLDLISLEQLVTMDNAITPEIIWYSVGHHSDDSESKVQLSLHLDSVRCQPSASEFSQTLAKVLGWLKVYARGDRKPFLRDDKDRGYVSKRISHWAVESYRNVEKHHLIRMSILCLFISLNVTMPFILGRITFVYYQKLTAKSLLMKWPQYVFWASSLSSALFNAAYVYVNVKRYRGLHTPGITKCVIAVHGHPCHIPPDTSLYKDVEMTFIAKAAIVPFALILEFFIAVVVPKNAEFPKPPCVVRILFYCCCDSWKGFFTKVIQTMALYQILFSVQILAVIAIPTCVFFFVTSLSTIFYVGLGMFFLVASILMVAYFLYACESLSNVASSWSICLKACGTVSLFSFVLVTSFTMILAVFCFFVVMYSGKDKTGAQGFIFSLLPTILLSLVGWAVKRRLCRARVLNRAHEEEQQQPRRSDGASDVEDGIVEMQNLLQEQDENEAS